MGITGRRPTLTDCGCEATVYADGSGIEMHYCPMHQAAKELLEALRLMLATEYPFARPDRGGMGLPYTMENLTIDAWAARRATADTSARAAIARAESTGGPCPVCRGTGADPLSDNTNWLPCSACGGGMR